MFLGNCVQHALLGFSIHLLWNHPWPKSLSSRDHLLYGLSSSVHLQDWDIRSFHIALRIISNAHYHLITYNCGKGRMCFFASVPQSPFPLFFLWCLQLLLLPLQVTVQSNSTQTDFDLALEVLSHHGFHRRNTLSFRHVKMNIPNAIRGKKKSYMDNVCALFSMAFLFSPHI